jgi:hypothetical protein
MEWLIFRGNREFHLVYGSGSIFTMGARIKIFEVSGISQGFMSKCGHIIKSAKKASFLVVLSNYNRCSYNLASLRLPLAKLINLRSVPEEGLDF